LVFGGSQGAKRLNEAVWGALPELRDKPISILHAFGPKTDPALVPAAPDGPVQYVPVPYVDRMDLAYAAADLAVCRSGAMTCGEIAAVGLPAVYVPFPIGNGEQRFNALPTVRAGGGLMVDDADFTPEWVARTLPPLIGDAARLERMSRAAESLGRRDADERVVAMVRQAVAAKETGR
jgi:UDP-N-acetylglucosamine--N-acetylmuramyl-(pentapeptide) pyrophosphoryl-undecaprenol N-acetylglucosamine transferase